MEKTTVATLLYNMFRKFGYKVGLLSTVCNYIDDKAVPADHTTPDPIELNELLAKMVAEGCEYALWNVLAMQFINIVLEDYDLLAHYLPILHATI